MLRLNSVMFYLSFTAFIAHLFLIQIAGKPNTQNEHVNEETAAGDQNPLPMILVPGFAASKLYARPATLSLKDACKDRQKNYTKLWTSTRLADRTAMKEEIQREIFSKLTLNHANHPANKLIIDTSNCAAFGDLSPTVCLFFDYAKEACDESIAKGATEAGFGPLVQWLTAESDLGYRAGYNLFAAPYDWRFEANSEHLNTFYADLTKKIENVKKETGKKVLLLQHSMGNLVGNYYLNHHHTAKNEHWQKEHLAASINVSAPFGGTVEVLEELLSGNSERYFGDLAALIKNHSVLPLARSLGSIAQMLPNHLGWPENVQKNPTVFVELHNQREAKINGPKGIGQFQALLKLAEAPGNFFEIYQKTIPQPLKHTKMYCIYGVGKDNTALKYIYEKAIKAIKNDNYVQPEPRVINGDGDDTVNVESLRVCKRWQSDPEMVQELEGESHAGILHNTSFFDFIKKIVQEN